MDPHSRVNYNRDFQKMEVVKKLVKGEDCVRIVSPLQIPASFFESENGYLCYVYDTRCDKEYQEGFGPRVVIKVGEEETVWKRSRNKWNPFEKIKACHKVWIDCKNYSRVQQKGDDANFKITWDKNGLNSYYVTERMYYYLHKEKSDRLDSLRAKLYITRLHQSGNKCFLLQFLMEQLTETERGNFVSIPQLTHQEQHKVLQKIREDKRRKKQLEKQQEDREKQSLKGQEHFSPVWHEYIHYPVMHSVGYRNTFPLPGPSIMYSMGRRYFEAYNSENVGGSHTYTVAPYSEEPMGTTHHSPSGNFYSSNGFDSSQNIYPNLSLQNKQTPMLSQPEQQALRPRLASNPSSTQLRELKLLDGRSLEHPGRTSLRHEVPSIQSTQQPLHSKVQHRVQQKQEQQISNETVEPLMEGAVKQEIFTKSSSCGSTNSPQVVVNDIRSLPSIAQLRKFHSLSLPPVSMKEKSLRVFSSRADPVADQEDCTEVVERLKSSFLSNPISLEGEKISNLPSIKSLLSLGLAAQVNKKRHKSIGVESLRFCATGGKEWLNIVPHTCFTNDLLDEPPFKRRRIGPSDGFVMESIHAQPTNHPPPDLILSLYPNVSPEEQQELERRTCERMQQSLWLG
eukprot:TRINITY_DN8628_c0_g1_i16.p1 TRINITY_DN8628_c0_g1~~TRINITY_DN8628_c0_g1_i16.p1  ORF type:complete len:646 (+),score=121.56 TRINITY_DN8628_c0_g1_i16:70-1938(+)